MKDSDIKRYASASQPKESWFIKYKPEIYLAVSIAFIAIILSVIYTHCGHDQAPTVAVPTKEVIKQVASREMELQRQLDSTNNHDGVLIARGMEFEKKYYASEKRVKEVLAAAKFDKAGLYQPPADTTAAKEYTQDLITAATNNNDACVEVITNLHAQVANRDTAIALQEVKYNSLKDGFNQVVANDFQKDATIKDLNKQLRGKKAVGWVYKGIIVAAAFIIIKSAVK